MNEDIIEKLHLLLVDDSEDHLLLTKTRLEQEDPELMVTICNSAEEALVKIPKSSFDCIVSDYEMKPGMNGMQFFSELRKRGINKPFIFLTGQGNEELAREAFISGIDDYFTKELGFAFFTKLIHAVRGAVGRHQVIKNLQYSHKFTENILNNIYEGFSVQDSSGRILFWSKQMEDITGWNQSDIIGKKIYDYFTSYDADLKSVTKLVIEKQENIELYIKMESSLVDERPKRLKAKLVPVTDPQMETIGYILLILDYEIYVSPADIN